MPVFDIGDIAAGLDQHAALPAQRADVVAWRAGLEVDLSDPLEIAAVGNTAAGETLLLRQPGAVLDRQLADGTQVRKVRAAAGLAQIDVGAAGPAANARCCWYRSGRPGHAIIERRHRPCRSAMSVTVTRAFVRPCAIARCGGPASAGRASNIRAGYRKSDDPREVESAHGARDAARCTRVRRPTAIARGCR